MADTGVCVSVSESPKFEVKSNMSPSEDLPNAGSCNGFSSRHEEDGNEEIKDETEASYVFVNRDSDNSAHRNHRVDPVLPVKTESNPQWQENCMDNGSGVGEVPDLSDKPELVETLDGGACQDGTQVRVEELDNQNSSVGRGESQDSEFYNSTPQENCMENGSAFGESLVLSDKKGHVESWNGEAGRKNNGVLVEELKNLNSSEELGEIQASEFKNSEDISSEKLPEMHRMDVSGEDIQSRLEVTHAEPDAYALDDKKLDNQLVDHCLEDAVDAEPPEIAGMIGSVETEESITSDSNLDSSPVESEATLPSVERGERLTDHDSIECKAVEAEATIKSVEREESVIGDSNLDSEPGEIEVIVGSVARDGSDPDDSSIDTQGLEAVTTIGKDKLINDEPIQLQRESVGASFKAEGPVRDALKSEKLDILTKDCNTNNVLAVSELVDTNTVSKAASDSIGSVVACNNGSADGSVGSREQVMCQTDTGRFETESRNTSGENDTIVVNVGSALEEADSTSEIRGVSAGIGVAAAIASVEAKLEAEQAGLEYEVRTVSVEIGEAATTSSVAEAKPKAEQDEDLTSGVRNVSVEIGELAATSLVEEPKLEVEQAQDLSSGVTNVSVEMGEVAATSSVEEAKHEAEQSQGLTSGDRNVSVEIGEVEATSSAEEAKPEPKQENFINEVTSTSLVEKTKPEAEQGNHSVETVQSMSTSSGIVIGSQSETSVSPAYDVTSETEVKCPSIESESGLEAENRQSLKGCPGNELKSGVEVSDCYVENIEIMPAQSSGDIDVERPQCLPSLPLDASVSEDEVRKEGAVESSLEGPAILNDDIKAQPDNCTISDIQNGPQLTSLDNGEKASCEVGEGLGGVAMSSLEQSASAELDGQKVDMEILKTLPNYIIRAPRFSDDELRARINQAQSEVNRKTEERDSIRMALQEKKAISGEYWDNVVAARSEEKAARTAVNAKFREMESVQIIVNRMKNATSVEDIEERILGMERMIEHETMHLKEEKQLIREIKQLKQFREQLCASMGTQAEMQEAFDQRDGIEERIKVLKQEIDSLKAELLRAENNTRAAKQKHSDESEGLKNLQAQFRHADSLRQQAYAEFQSLKKQMYEKSKYFHMYRDDQKTAVDLASARDREALWRFCSNQVERFMELWNKNDEFRNEYVKHNMMSTIRRLRTPDGRSLGPDEEPTVILRNNIEEKTTPARAVALSSTSTREMVQDVPGAPATPEKAESKPAAEIGPKNLSTKSKKTSKAISAEFGLATISGRVEEPEEPVESVEKERKMSKEEEELARKEEELKREEAVVKLKEQRRLEEIAKAKEAEERKRRNAEKAKARAELRAKKEAEQKEKEREKKAKRKLKKRGIEVDGPSGDVNEEPAQALSENIAAQSVEEPEVKEKPATVVRKYTKTMPIVKTKSIPPLPLRNRNKRKMQPWMWWALLAVALLIIVYLALNSTFSSRFN